MFSSLRQRNVGVLLGLLFGVALFSPAHSTNHYPPQAKATKTEVTVKIYWVPSHLHTHVLCSAVAGITPPKDGMILGCYLPDKSLIITVQPTSFNDARNLEILGHEFWHALGAEHP